MNERTLSKVLVMPTAVVMLILAILLYRWNNQMSDATSVRMADTLQMTMGNWHLNFYRDLADVAAALRVDSESSGNFDLYIRRFKEWKATARYPEMAIGVYLFKEVRSTTPTIAQLNVASNSFEPLSSLSDPMTRLGQKLARAPRAEKDAAPTFPRGLAGWKFEPETPALVRSIESFQDTWLVVPLDRRVIETRILPALSSRYFGGTDGLDFLVAIVSGPANRKVIYSSEPGFASSELRDADGVMDIFGQATAREYGTSTFVFHKLPGTPDHSVGPVSFGPSWFPLLDESPGEANDQNGWQLVVLNRHGGSLGSFVADTRRRNLAIGFGALLLLAVSVALAIAISLKANRLARLQMDFVTAVSHELRSPLTIIGSAAENITHGLVRGEKQVEQYGQVIESQTRRLSRLVEEVLLFASTREKRHVFDVRRLDAADIVESALESTSDLIAASQFTIEKRVAKNLPQVRGDLSALSQCLQNLITNALKYGGESRWLGLQADVHEDGTGRVVRISVSDRGMGIDESDLPHIFEPFYRASSARTAQIRGTGLGLALAKNIADAVQGRLTVVSRSGAGTTFTLHLPAIDDAPQPATVPTPSVELHS